MRVAHRALGLRVGKKYRHFSPLLDKFKLPLLMEIWEKHYGLHAILAVEHSKKVKAFRVLNFKSCKQVSMDGWIFDEDLYHYMNTRRKSDFAAAHVICTK